MPSSRVVILGLFLATAASPSPPPPIERAKDALNGLLRYFVQVESGTTAPPSAKGCPCYDCAGNNCTIPTCTFCSALIDDPCKVKKVGFGCYANASTTCTCNRPPGPIPPNATSPATFFFACGQMGGLGPRDTGAASSSCLCEVAWPFACTNCYRWWSAVALEAAANYVIESGIPLNNSMATRVIYIAESVWIHSPYNADWEALQSPVFIDDFAWYAIAYLRVYDLTKNDVWRRRAAAIHDWAWKYGYDHRNRSDSAGECGGFWWNMDVYKHFKDSISIVEVLHVAARLATPITPSINRTHFLDSAISIWNWIFDFDNGSGLLAANGIMSTGAQPEWCCNPRSSANESLGRQCANSRVPGMSYNHGLLMSSGALLYNITGKKEYLTRGLSLLDAAYENLTNADGAVRDLQRGSRALVYSDGYCSESSGDPGSDFFSFKGIFVTHLTYFAQTLRKSRALDDDALTKVRSIATKSSENAWTKSRVAPPFNATADACGDGVKRKNATFSKYHWWWTTSNVSLETPPNPYLWFYKTGVKCSYSQNSSIVYWKGNVATKDDCQAHCANTSYANCTKFVFSDGDYSTASCPCFECDGTPCYQPDCRYCETRAHKACPTKTTHSGCYTTAKAACTCNSQNTTTFYNCLLYKQMPAKGFDREKGPSCAVADYDCTLVAKRPDSPTDPSMSCRGRCGSDSTGGSCFCDASCARHFDCCLDYADECLPVERKIPSCLKRCQSAVAHPIPGGGYCFCNSGCANDFTDNNSYGGCCADYTWRCASGMQDEMCLDARTQTQAISVFVAHHVVEELERS